MRRTYDPEARRLFIKILKNGIKAVKQGLVHNPGDLGCIADSLSNMALHIAIKSETQDDEDDEDCVSTQTIDLFNNATPCKGLKEVMDKNVWVLKRPDLRSQSKFLKRKKPID